MLDLALLRAEPARVKAALARRGVPAEAVDAVLDLQRRWSARQEVRQALRTRRRRISDEVARRKRDGTGDAAEPAEADAIRAGRAVSRDLQAVDHAMAALAARREAALLALPNLPATDVPAAPPALAPSGPAWPHAFPPLAHWDLVEMLGLAASAGASAGGGCLLWRGAGARLVRGLVRFMLDVHTREGGREEVLAPPVATREALTASAHLPTLEEKMYRVVEPGGDPSRGVPSREREHEKERGGSPHPPRDAHDERGRCGDQPRNSDSAARDADLFLAPRAEPHLAALYAGEVLDADRLPVRLVAAATALRRTPHGGGAGGRGLLRLGAFPTVEVYTLCRPEASEAELERALAGAETILERLEVAHRRRVRAAADLSHAAARTVSLDAWCPGLPGEEDKNERGGSPPPPRDADDEAPPSRVREHADTPEARGERRVADEDTRDLTRLRQGYGGQAFAARKEGEPGAPGRWVEVAALSSFTDYQARRTGTRFRDADGATLRSDASLRSTSRARLVHTVGGAAVAVPRLLAALLETGQQADGSVRLPAALAPYVGMAVLGAT